MTEEQIKDMATIAFQECNHIPNTKIPKEFVIAFAKLVAEHEREACAKVCDEASKAGSNVAYVLAKAIRARGEA